MKKLLIHIVEDESIIAMDLEGILLNLGHEVDSISTSYDEVLNKLPTNTSDLFLVDIQLQGKKNGLKVAKELEKRNIPHIYISSLMDDDILQYAKKTNAYGYILKPFDLSDIFVAIEMASGRIEKELTKQSIFIKDGKGRVQVRIDDVLYAAADGNYTHIHTLERTFTLRGNLKSIHESVLNFSMFERVHKSFVVNTYRIKKIIKSNLILIDGTQIPIGRKQEKFGD